MSTTQTSAQSHPAAPAPSGQAGEGKPANRSRDKEREFRIGATRFPVGDLEIVLIVLFAGALGGILAMGLDYRVYPLWATEVLIDNGLPPISSLWLIPIGAGAAGISVFYVAKSDTRNILHTFFFALLCGSCGPALLLNAMGSLVDTKAGTSAVVSDAKAENKKADERVKSGNAGAAIPLAESAAKDAMLAKDAANKQGQPRLEKEAQETALSAVANVALSAKNENVVAEAAASLGSIRADAAVRQNVAVVAAVNEAAKSLPSRVSIESGAAIDQNLSGGIQKFFSDNSARVVSVRTVKDVMPREVRLLYYKRDDRTEAYRILKGIAESLGVSVSDVDGSDANFATNHEPLNEKAYIHYVRSGETREDILPGGFDLRIGKDRLAGFRVLSENPNKTDNP